MTAMPYPPGIWVEMLPGVWAVIPMEIFQDTHEALAEEFRQKGLTGYELDLAIAENIPHRLALVMNNHGTRH
jgi:hypothetical protein